MIKINLITRVSRKEEELKRILFGLSSLSLMLIAGVFYLSVTMTAEVNQMQKKLQVAKLEYKQMEGKMKKLQRFKNMKTSLNNKLNIIKDLKDKQAGPVKMLDILSNTVPGEIWVESVKNMGNLTIKGLSFSNPAIADFMEGLEKKESFKNIKLLQSVQRTVKSRKVKAFQIVADIDFNSLKKYSNLKPLGSKDLLLPLKMMRKVDMKEPLNGGVMAKVENRVGE